MDLGEQKQNFYQLVFPSHPNDWEVEEAMELLAEIPADYRRALLAHVPTIWPISHSLCFSFLGEGVKGASHWPPELLAEWVRQILARYEEAGLRAARDFMGDIEKNFLEPLHGNAGVAVDEIRGAMVPYLRGVSGLALDLAADGRGRLWTDTRTIYLPGRQRPFPERVDNLLFLRFTIILQWACIAEGIFHLQPRDQDFAVVATRYGTGPGNGRIDDYLACFPSPVLAGRLLLLYQLPRIFGLVRRRLPGLVRAVQPLCRQLLEIPAGRCGRRGDQVRELLLSIPNVGPTKADHVMSELGIAASKRIGGLGVRQRERLRVWLAGRERVGRRERSRLVVLAGPTAVGKGMVSQYIREHYPDVLLSVSATTRPPRPGEVDGRHYYFVSDAEFDRMIADGEFLEWATVHNAYRYGTPRPPIERALAAGRSVLLEIDLQGARAVRAAMPEALLVFLLPPSWEELVRRLVGRGTESPAEQARRLQTARLELEAQDEFDVQVVNREVGQAAHEVVELLAVPAGA